MKLFFTIGCFCILNFGFSQTEIQLKNKLKKELQKMESQGATFQDISDKFFIKYKYQYIMSLEDYVRSGIYLNYMKGLYVSKKITEGSLTEEDDKILDRVNANYSNYQEYLEYKKTLKAKEKWESNIDDGVLKLVVSDLNKYNEKDKKRFKDLKDLFDRDIFFTKFIITDSKHTKTITRD
jgi:hypothetical protein